jgi:hypothetical protein
MKTTFKIQAPPEIMAAIKNEFECYTDKKLIAQKFGISIYHLDKLFPEYKRKYKPRTSQQVE